MIFQQAGEDEIEKEQDNDEDDGVGVIEMEDKIVETLL